ncbi:hypothetical protein [Oscillibacter sp.]|nr:hypothetical protein [Oscillibacter sp.]
MEQNTGITLGQRLEAIDAGSLNRTDRLALAHTCLKCVLWDEILGPKPEGFDDLPKFSKEVKKPFRPRQHMRSKRDYTEPAAESIERIVGEANISRFWWVVVFGRTEEDWFRWYTVERFLSPEERMILQRPPQQSAD